MSHISPHLSVHMLSMLGIFSNIDPSRFRPGLQPFWKRLVLPKPIDFPCHLCQPFLCSDEPEESSHCRGGSPR